MINIGLNVPYIDILSFPVSAFKSEIFCNKHKSLDGNKIK